MKSLFDKLFFYVFLGTLCLHASNNESSTKGKLFSTKRMVALSTPPTTPPGSPQKEGNSSGTEGEDAPLDERLDLLPAMLRQASGDGSDVVLPVARRYYEGNPNLMCLEVDTSISPKPVRGICLDFKGIGNVGICWGYADEILEGEDHYSRLIRPLLNAALDLAEENTTRREIRLSVGPHFGRFGYHLSSDDVRYLMDQLHVRRLFPRLVSLDLADHRFGDDGFDWVIRHLDKMENLCELHVIRGNNLSDPDAAFQYLWERINFQVSIID